MRLSVKVVRNSLLEDWKKGKGKAEFGGVKFQADAPDVPQVEEMPTLTCCKLAGDGADMCLAVPVDIRQKFLADPVHAPEWRSILKAFDKKHGIATVPTPSLQPPPASPAGGNQWKDIFAADPKSINDLEKKFPKIAATFPVGDGLVCHVVEGPQFFIAAPTSAGTCPSDQCVLGHGGGVWLLDAKATKAIQDSLIVIYDI